MVKAYKLYPAVQKALAKAGLRAPSSSLDPISVYWSIAEQLDVLKKEESYKLFNNLEQALAIYITGNVSLEQQALVIKGVVAYNLLYLSNLRYVISVAGRYTRRGLPYIDIIHEGNIGLTSALCRFDTRKNRALTTYADDWIRKAIRRAIAFQSREIRLPVHMHERHTALIGTINDLCTKLNRTPTLEETARHVGMPVEELTELLRVGEIHLPSLDTPLGDDNTLTLGGVIPDRHNAMHTISDTLADQIEVDRIFMGTQLTNFEKAVLALHSGTFDRLPKDLEVYNANNQPVPLANILAGLLTTKGLSHGEIGEIFGVTAHAIWYAEKRAFRKARLILGPRDT